MRHFFYGLGNKGIMLLETVVAVLIAGIATGAVIGTFIVGKYATQRSKHRVAAINRISEELEQVLSTNYADIIDGTYLDNIVIDDKGTADVGDDLIGLQTILITEIAAGTYGYKEVRATMAWTEQGWGGASDLSENLVTYVTDK